MEQENPNYEIVFFYEGKEWRVPVYNKFGQELPANYIKDCIGNKLYELLQNGMILPVKVGQTVTVKDVRSSLIGVPNDTMQSYPYMEVCVKRFDMLSTSV